MRVLSGYAGRHGSTKGTAERIAVRLEEHGHSVDTVSLLSAAEARGYDAAVLGSAVHDTAWLAEARDYVHRNAAALAERPVWLYSLGMARIVGGWFEAHAQEPKGIAAIRAEIRPREHHLFAGRVERDQISRKGRIIYGLMRGRYGDFRDWAEIDAWARRIATELAAIPQEQ